MRHLLLALLLAIAIPTGSAPALADNIRELTWSELIPADAPPLPPQQQMPIHDLTQLADALAAESGPAAQQSMPDAPVVEELDGQQIKLPGYIVPLDVTEEGRVTEFLFVPYFGACIHVPPPPSNQIVHVTAELGVLLDALYQPFWIEGPLKVGSRSSEMGTAGYQVAADKIYPYEM
ncbi:DUF3299 domain-containing protein [Pseudomonas sp. zbq_18]|uniref:DUF3299 domain-containing protein n=1 Tax=Pseudomonas sp. zbq_18 TaxID=3367251 RepID=UPI00370AA9BD